MSFRVHVRVMPRAGLLDPQGQAVEHALVALGLRRGGRRARRPGDRARGGGGDPRAEAEARVRQMCDKLLANPVTEDYLLEVEERLMLKVAVVRFPGSNCDLDALRAAERVGRRRLSRLASRHHLQGADVVILPGGFSYGDYLRSGRHRAVQPDHAGRPAPRRRRRPGARHLQRVPDPLRGAPAARRAAAQRAASPSCRSRWTSSSSAPTPSSPRRTRRATGSASRWPTATAASWPPTTRCACSRPRAGSCSATWPAAEASPLQPNPNGSANHIAGICNAAGTVVGHHAPPRAGRRPAPRQPRRARILHVARGLASRATLTLKVPSR